MGERTSILVLWGRWGEESRKGGRRKFPGGEAVIDATEGRCRGGESDKRT